MEIYSNRKYIIQGFFILISVIFLFWLFYIQVLDNKYKELADSNVIRKETVYPPRGLLYDRNGTLIVSNAPIYDLMVVPYQVTEMDTISFCKMLGITKSVFEEQLKKAKKYSKYRPSIFLRQLSVETYAKFQEHLYEFPGFFGQTRLVRDYSYKNAAHALGYISEVDETQIEASNGFYKMGDYIGLGGIEQTYEKELRGKRGFKYILVDVHNREQGSFDKGSDDLIAIPGKSLVTTLDINLQAYGELLMQNKKGSIVAIEPNTGEILTLVSSPSYDPALLVGRKRGENFEVLKNDTLKPLFNRAIMAQYPPGSPIKPLMALIALQEKVITHSTFYTCNSGYHMRGLTVGCLSPGVFNLRNAIRKSCNGFFCFLYRKIIDQARFETAEQGFINWRNYLLMFGLGSKLGIDIPNEKTGLVPSVALYDKMYGSGRWKSSTTISLAIGQGELGVTPLQLVNYIAAIANKGYFYTPHLVKKIENDSSVLNFFQKKHHIKIDTSHFTFVRNAMEEVVLYGTARIARIEHISMCGKTGTAENPHGKDHSFFVAFAPKEDPKISIMVVVENSGYGASYAAPIASLMIEKYLTDSISRPRVWLEKRMLEINLIQ